MRVITCFQFCDLLTRPCLIFILFHEAQTSGSDSNQGEFLKNQRSNPGLRLTFSSYVFNALNLLSDKVISIAINLWFLVEDKIF